MPSNRATLRPYQNKFRDDIYASWDAGARNTLAVLPTGAGKTVVFSEIIHDHKGASVAIAHRQELISQISLALARDEVRHKIIGPDALVRLCVSAHMEELGTSFFDPSARCAVAGVDTLTRRDFSKASWPKNVSLVVQDEAHHVLTENKWGKAFRLFPNAKGLGVTATPLRADGKGLGSHADGIFDAMVEGPDMRELINAGYLSEYRVFAPQSDLVRDSIPVSSSTGDFKEKELNAAVNKSRITGDVVEHYLRIAYGKRGITFARSVETAAIIADKFNASGVPAKVISAKTPTHERVKALREFKHGDLWQLTNVGLFGEGFDVPAIEVVSTAWPTKSFSMYAQWFGRMLRILAGKTHGFFIDHGGNVEHFNGPPDVPRKWSLDRREGRISTRDPDVIPVHACPKCTAVYERIYKQCPYCLYKPEILARSEPAFVDGDLYELSPEVLAAMRGEVERVDMDKEAYRLALVAKGTPAIGQLAHVKRHVAKQEAQTTLRESIAWWAGHQRAQGRPDSESYRRFYFRFGIDVLSAQSLKSAESAELTQRINEHIGAMLHG